MSASKKRKSPNPKKSMVPIIVGRDEYEVDGGRILPIGAQVDLTGPGEPYQRAVTLFVPRGELGFYPIGAKVRVTIERLS